MQPVKVFIGSQKKVKTVSAPCKTSCVGGNCKALVLPFNVILTDQVDMITRWCLNFQLSNFKTRSQNFCSIFCRLVPVVWLHLMRIKWVMRCRSGRRGVESECDGNMWPLSPPRDASGWKPVQIHPDSSPNKYHFSPHTKLALTVS